MGADRISLRRFFELAGAEYQDVQGPAMAVIFSPLHRSSGGFYVSAFVPLGFDAESWDEARAAVGSLFIRDRIWVAKDRVDPPPAEYVHSYVLYLLGPLPEPVVQGRTVDVSMKTDYRRVPVAKTISGSGDLESWETIRPEETFAWKLTKDYGFSGTVGVDVEVTPNGVGRKDWGDPLGNHFLERVLSTVTERVLTTLDLGGSGSTFAEVYRARHAVVCDSAGRVVERLTAREKESVAYLSRGDVPLPKEELQRLEDLRRDIAAVNSYGGGRCRPTHLLKYRQRYAELRKEGLTRGQAKRSALTERAEKEDSSTEWQYYRLSPVEAGALKIDLERLAEEARVAYDKAIAEAMLRLQKEWEERLQAFRKEWEGKVDVVLPLPDEHQA